MGSMNLPRRKRRAKKAWKDEVAACSIKKIPHNTMLQPELASAIGS